MTKLFIIAAAVIGIGLVACTKARNAKKEKSETTEVKEKVEDAAKAVGNLIETKTENAVDSMKEKAKDAKDAVK